MNRTRVFALLALLGLPVVAPQAVPLPAALWSGENNALESIGSRNGTLANGTGFDDGQVGRAFRFDGVDDHVIVSDDPLWTFGTSDFSIGLWANFDQVRSQSIGQLPNVFIGQDEGAGTTDKWVFFFDDEPEGQDSGRLAFHINGSVGSVFLTSPDLFSVTPGGWHHFALTRSGSTYTFYADGQSLGTRTDARAIPDAAAPLTIGQAEGLGFFDGRLDEVAIYGAALSAADVAEVAGIAVAEPDPLLLLGAALGATLLRRRRHTRLRVSS